MRQLIEESTQIVLIEKVDEEIKLLIDGVLCEATITKIHGVNWPSK